MGPRRRNASQYLHQRRTTSASCLGSGCWQRHRPINNTSRKCINEFSAKFSVYKMQKMSKKRERSKMLLVYLFCDLNGSINHCLTGFQGAPRAWQRFEYVAIAIVVVPLSVPAASLSLFLFLPCCKSNSYLMKHFGLGCCCHPCRKY